MTSTTPTHTDQVVKLDEVTEFPGNPRTHSEAQLTELERSLTMFGQFRPLVLDDQKVVLAGNGMLAAMRRLGWAEGKATVITGLSEAEKKKLVLADNRIAGMGYTDYDEVDRILSEINDTQVPGYEEEFLRQMLATAEEVLAEAETYGAIPEEELTSTRESTGTYSGENVPQHFQAPVEVDAGDDYIKPVELTIPQPKPEEVPHEAATTQSGEEVQVCSACKRPW